MNPIPMDDETQNRLFAGTLDPDDAPPGFSGVAAVLRAAGAAAALVTTHASGSAQQLVLSSKEQQQVAAMVQAMSAGEPAVATPKPRRSMLWRAKVGGLAIAGMLFGSTGLAMAGALPSGAQNFAATVLSKVGISVPHHPSNQSPDQSGTLVPSPKPSQGPDPNGPAKFGLCNAYAHGQGGVNGGKFDSVAFQNLQKAATAAGQSVQDFCKGATPGGKPAGQNHGQGKGHSKNHTNNGHHGGGNGPPASPPGRVKHGGQ
jgi:hypothetical protein